MARLAAIGLWLILALIPRIGLAAEASTLTVTQSVDSAAKGLASVIVAREGGLQNGNGNGDPMFDIGGRKITDTRFIPRIEVKDYGNTKLREQLLADAKAFTIGGQPGEPGVLLPFIAALQAYAEANNIVELVFNFNQKVSLRGDPAFKYLVWTAVLRQGRIPRFPEPQLLDAAPAVLQIIYTPQLVVKGLPRGLSYPNAGTLRWRKLDASLMPLTEWARIGVSAAYDMPSDIMDAPVDNDVGVKCLANRAAIPTCPKADNVADLLKKAQAGYAILDYGRALQPVYDTVQPDRRSDPERVLRVAMSVDYREWVPGGCAGGTFINRGSYGVVLNNPIDRYYIWGNGTFQRIDTFTSQVMASTTSFDVKKTDIRGETPATLAEKIVNVAKPSAPLLLTSKVPNIVKLAPITATSSATGNTLVIADYFYAHCGRAFGATASCDADGNVQLTFGVSSSVSYCGPRDNKFYQSQTYTLHKGTPLQKQTTVLEYANSFSWSYDGDRTVLFSRGDWLGNDDPGTRIGMSLFASELFFPSAGYYLQQNFPSGGPINFYFEGQVCPEGSIEGDRIFPPDSFWHDNYVDKCIQKDPKGPIAGECNETDDRIECPHYRIVGTKIWGPTRKDPGMGKRRL